MPGSGGDQAEGMLGVALGAGSALGLSDGALIERFATRPGSVAGEAAFAALVARHGAMVRQVCRQTLRSDADADDAYQAVFLVLARRAGAIRDPDLLAPWLHGVALRTARLARRRRRFGAPLTEELVSDRPDSCPVEANEARQALHAEVARLPEPQRRAVILCHLEGLTHDEAARRLGVPTGTVSVRLMRARQRLHARLARRGFAPGGALLWPSLTRDGTILPPRAWAALSHLRGQPAGEVPVGIASLASGASSMIPSLTKVSTVALFALATAATGAWTLAQGPVQPISAPSASTSQKAEASSAPPPSPALAEFRRLYHLEPGQILKRIPPPFASWRMAELLVQVPDANQLDLSATSVTYKEKDGRLRVNGRFHFGKPNGPGVPIRDLIVEFSDKRFPTIEGPSDLLDASVPGDWISAAVSTPSDRLASFASILRDECQIPVRFSRHDQEREVIVIQGSFQPRHLFVNDPKIYVYGATIVEPQHQVSQMDDLTGLLGALGRFIRPERILVDETAPIGRGRIQWQENARTPATEQTTREDRDAETVLRHVAEQTGLTFTTERRRVPVITVERTH